MPSNTTGTSYRTPTVTCLLLLTLPVIALSQPTAPVANIEVDGVHLQVNWSTVEGASKYTFYFAPSPYSGPESIQSIGMGNNTSIEGNLWIDAAFYIAISASNEDGESELSNVLLVEMPEEQVLADYLHLATTTLIDWPEYENEIAKLSTHYSPLPVGINVGEKWFSSLQIAESEFSTRNDYFESDLLLRHGVGYRSFTTVSENSELVFYSNWIPEFEENSAGQGAGMVVEYIDDFPTSFDAFRFGGADHSWVVNNSDGTQTAIFMGRDEGQGSPALSYLAFYDIENKSWSKSDFRVSVHNSVVMDYDNDGDDDIFADGGAEPFFGHNWLLRNDDGEYQAVKIGGSGDERYAGLAIGPIGYNEDGTFSIAIGDDPFHNECNCDLLPTQNYILNVSSDLTTELSTSPLPTAYFDTPIFNDVPQVIPEWDNTNGKSHDIAIKAIDFDYDGDLDLIVSSSLWSNEFPFGVLQLLVNDGGVYKDETDSRLYNWVLAGSAAHKLDFIDVNFDGYVDILLSDHGYRFQLTQLNSSLDKSILSGSRVLINDGTGNFLTIMHQQINNTGDFLPSHIPSISEKGSLKWTSVNPNGTEQVEVITRYLNIHLSTGPNGIDPAKYGAHGFNEFYYLLHNSDVAAAVSDGTYLSGLHHYLLVGKEENRAVNASSK